MAKIKFGMMMTDARGKLGGQVFSKNRGGSYVRTKVTPANPQTTAQVQARARLGQFSSGWSGLTEEERLAWNSAVSSYAKTDIFGDLRNPTGKNLYAKLNINLSLIGASPILKPTSPVALIDPINAAFSVAESEDIQISNLPVVTEQRYIVQAIANQSAGTYNFSGKYVNIGVFIGSASPIEITAEVVAKFGLLVSGKKLALRIFVVSSVTGQSSAGVQISSIIT